MQGESLLPLPLSSWASVACVGGVGGESLIFWLGGRTSSSSDDTIMGGVIVEVVSDSKMACAHKSCVSDRNMVSSSSDSAMRANGWVGSTVGGERIAVWLVAWMSDVPSGIASCNDGRKGTGRAERGDG